MKKLRIEISSEETHLNVDFENDLNPEQQAVVMHPGGPMLVLAGAGSGKTRTVTYRVGRLISTGVEPSAILLLTFTNKASREMMQRAEQLVGQRIRGLWGGTFHHIGNIILRRHGTLLGYREGFSILDREDQKELLETSKAERKETEGLLPRGAVLADILSYHKNTQRPVEEIIAIRYPFLIGLEDEVTRVFISYESRKLRLNMMDFDDLLINTLRLFEEHQEILQYYASRFQHILVDEYQDTNLIQAMLIDRLASIHRNIMVVGDDAQSIYSFRGARTENILGFPDRYPDTAIFRLTTNYRSRPEILELTNASILHNTAQFRKELHAVRPSGTKPMLVCLEDLFEQAAFVATRITELHDEGIPLEEMAVLYRSHYQSMELQIELQRRGIPFEVRSGLRFFEQAHIKDIISYLRVLLNPYDELGWKRILRMVPHVGNVTADRIWRAISQTADPLSSISSTSSLVSRRAGREYLSFVSVIEGLMALSFREHPAEAISYILRNGYEDYLQKTYPNAESRREDILQLIRYAERYTPSGTIPYTPLELLLSDLTLEVMRVGEEEKEGDEHGGLILSSVHQAKGLEWRHLFIVGMNDGRFPSKKAIRTEGLEEERRLFYVACTRAMDELYICYTLTDDGYSPYLKPSRFITELPRDLYEEIELERV